METEPGAPGTKKPIVYLGPRGTFSEVAVRQYLRRLGARGEEFEPLPLPSIPQVVRAVDRGEAPRGVVPLENSLEGPVTVVSDLLVHEADVRLCGEVLVKVEHALLARPGTERGEIRVVASHPHALAQCRRFLERELPVEQVPVYSTAEAARLAAERPGWAALGAALAADVYGLGILAAGVQDSAVNVTRFGVLGKEEMPPTGHDKTSLAVVPAEGEKDRPGRLFGILRPFAERLINLTRIESRPTRRRLGEYLFLIDVVGHPAEGSVAAALAEVQALGNQVRILGAYPMDLSLQEQEGRERGEG